MKTGIIIEADVTSNGINHISVHRTCVKGEDWVHNENNERPTIKDINDWMQLLVEGVITVISAAHKNGLKDESHHLREVINRLQDSFVMPSEVNTVVSKEEIEYVSPIANPYCETNSPDKQV